MTRMRALFSALIAIAAIASSYPLLAQVTSTRLARAGLDVLRRVLVIALGRR